MKVVHYRQRDNANGCLRHWGNGIVWQWLAAMRMGGYGLARISRLLKIIRVLLQNIVFFIGLFCKRDL